MSRPGQWLRWVAARVCGTQTTERLVDPIVADIQVEHDEAVVEGRRWRAAWICARGYGGFWRAVGLHAVQSAARALSSAVRADEAVLGRTLAYSVIAFVTLTLLLTAPPMAAYYSDREDGLRLSLLLVPQTIPLSIPIALSFGIVCGYGARMVRGQVRAVMPVAIVATLLSFAAMLTLPHVNQAWRVAVGRQLGMQGITYHSLPKGMNEMSFSELAAAIRDHDARGLRQTARTFSRSYHIRFALPSATFALSLLALGIGSLIRRRAVRVVALLIAIAAYWGMLALGERNPMLPPMLAAWAPNIVCTAAALWLLKQPSARPHGIRADLIS